MMSNQISFQSWLDSCTLQRNDTVSSSSSSSNQHPSQGGTDEKVTVRLRREARSHFEALSTSSSKAASSSSTSIVQDISKASSTTPNGALALLVSSLGPAFSSSASTDAKLCALHCLTGALEGSDNLTHGVRQAVGRFLVELCRPEVSRDGESDDDDEIDMDQPMDYVDGDNLTSEEVTQQLQAMEKAHEQRKQSSATRKSRKDASSSLTHDDVRDAAMAALKALVRSHLEIFPTQQSQQHSTQSPTNDPATKAVGVVQESMGLRVELAMLGVRYRCQTADKSNSSNGDKGVWGGSGDGYETADPNDLNIEDGLSQLPRLKRSICFNLLEGALDGLKEDGVETKKIELDLQSQSSLSSQGECSIPSSLLKSMSAFAILASSCMHGETDPRCLLQLMRLLNKTQQVMMPLFDSDANNASDEDQMDMDSAEVMFPSVEIFDAVAPYYPVQFTPPKNDPHGITCDVLQGALMAVLCESGTFYKGQIIFIYHAPEDVEAMETMTMLAARMFLERLEPPKSADYDPPSNGAESEDEDKLGALRDLSSLLLSSPDSADSSEQQYSTNVTRVAPAFFSELSSSMARVHEEAISSDTNSLASAIRKFSSSLAYSLEPSATASRGSHGNTTPLWEAYVVDILRHLTPTLGSSPQSMHGRASTAYLASLAAEGGLMTLRKVLDGCYHRFLGVLAPLDSDADNAGESPSKSQSSKQKSRDEEKMAAAMRGIAALVSSCRVALKKWQCDNPGVQVYPHPLSAYLSATIQKIAFVLNESIGDEVGLLSLAAVGALESILTSADLNALEEINVISLEKSFSLMSSAVLSDDETIDNHEWKTACARVLGAVLSVGLGGKEGSEKKDSDGDATISSCERMRTLATHLLPEILAAATSGASSKAHAIRYDWIVIAGACANGSSHVSEKIVSELLSSIIAALRARQDARSPAMALSHIVLHGGHNVSIAFHSLSSPGPTPFDIIQELCSSEVEGETPSIQALKHLQLPESCEEDAKKVIGTIDRAYSIIPFLIPAYECTSSITSCNRLVQFVDQILPPLSDCDEVKLCVSFPLLAAVLSCSHRVWKMLDSATLETLMSMTRYLAEFSISSDHDTYSRSAAASCLFSVLFHGSQNEECEGDMIQKLLEEVVPPKLSNALNCLEKQKGNDTLTSSASGSTGIAEEVLHTAFSLVENTLSFLGLLGSAAACKGGPYAQTADKIGSFLIELACTGTSQFPFTHTQMQLVTPSEEGQKHPLLSPASHAHILPASSFGNMLTVENGGPFWKQRMTHKTLPVLLRALQVQAKAQNPPALGTLAVVCHMLCCLPSSLLGKSNIQQIIPTLIAGLVYFSKNVNAFAQSEKMSSKPADLLSIILAALVKILALSPEDVSKFIGIIIPSLLLLSSPAASSETYIPKQLMVFQCLESVAGHPHARNSILREKDQVVAVLSAVVDQSSSIIRSAVVQVRNVWYTLT